MKNVWFVLGLLFVFLSGGFVSAEAVYHGLYTAPFDRFVNLRLYNNSQNPIVFHGANRSYYQKIEGPINGVYYMYYSDANTTGGATYMAVANSTDGDHWKFVRYSKTTGHPYVLYNQGGFPGLNNDHIYFIWDQLTVGHGAYLKEIRVYYSNTSDGTGLKDMGWLNMTWTVGASNNGTIAGTNGFNKIFYNASGSGGHSRNPFDYKFAIFYDCIGQSAENFCVVGTDDPLKINRSSLHKVILNQTGANWDALKTGFGDIVRYKGYYLAWYEGGKTSTREALGLAYSLNGSGGFVKMSQNPILKKSSNKYMNKSVGGASIKIEGNVARLYVAGMNFTKSSTYQIMEYIYDIRNDKNVTITGVSGASSQIMNRTNGVLYNYNSSSGGDKVLLLTGVKYNIRVKPDSRNMVFISGLNGTNAGDIDLRVQTAVSKPANTQALSSVIYSSATGFDVATLYFNKSVDPTKICSCQYWNISLALCNSAWVCNATSAYQHGSNATQYWINVTHFSGYALGNDTPYAAPSVVNISVSPISALQGQNVTINVNVNRGGNDLSHVWYNLNNTLGDWTYATNGSNVFILYTGDKLGSYSVLGYVNDSNNTVRSSVGSSVNIYTTTTSTTTTTTLRGSIRLNVSSGGDATAAGTKVIISQENGTVVGNTTVSTNSSMVNSSIYTNAFNYKMSITTPKGDKIVFNRFNMTKINQTIRIQTSNVSGVKPVPLRVYDGVLASNASGFGRATIVFNVSKEPNYICGCTTWNYDTSSCSVGWVCNLTKDYQRRFANSRFYVNVSHFSAYVVGSGDRVEIWDNPPHYPGFKVGLYANFSNMSGQSINGTGGYCQIMVVSGGYHNMTFNQTSRLYQYNVTEGLAGGFTYYVTCDGTGQGYDRLSVSDTFYVSAAPQSDTKNSMVFWYVAYSVAHSISYGAFNSSAACDQMNQFYVDGVTGTISKVNASTDKTGAYHCQNTTQGVMIVHNDGTVGLNISASFSYVTPGITMKLGHSNVGWQSACSGTCGGLGCDLSSSCLKVNVSPVQIAYNMPQNGSKEYWLWADFKNVAGTPEPTKGNFTTNATRYSTG